MGSRGPIPDPKSRRSQAGRNTRTKKTTTAAPAGELEVPESVQLVPAAAAFWDRVAPQLIADGRLVAEQADAFAILCRLHADIRHLEDQVLAEGFVTATDKGQAASPIAKLLRDARRDFVSLARDFGLTAAAAARIPQEPTDGEEEGDEEAAVLARLSIRGG
jgi:P27 family predicted phage terminase small subunit